MSEYVIVDNENEIGTYDHDVYTTLQEILEVLKSIREVMPPASNAISTPESALVAQMGQEQPVVHRPVAASHAAQGAKFTAG